jgi:ribosome maturation factor RimP
VVEQKIDSLLTDKFQEEEFQDCFLLEVNVHPNNKIDVFIDSDTGITFEKCQKISRYLESYLDAEGWVGEKYVLEVSSPGVSRPLTLLRQYHKNIGRRVEVSPHEGEPLEGKLVAVGDDHIVVEEKIRIKEGKKKKTEIRQSEIPFAEIKKTIVKISFN